MDKEQERINTRRCPCSYYDEAELSTCPLIKLGYRKPLDRPQLKEKLYNTIEDRVMTKTIHTGQQIDDLIGEILALIIPKDKPPLLSDEELSERWHMKEHSNSNDGSWHFRLGTLRWLAQAQREADIKHYEEVK